MFVNNFFIFDYSNILLFILFISKIVELLLEYIPILVKFIYSDGHVILDVHRSRHNRGLPEAE